MPRCIQQLVVNTCPQADSELIELIVISIEAQHTFFGRQLPTHVQHEVWLMAPTPGFESF